MQITLQNPWTKAVFQQEVSEIIDRFNSYLSLIDNEIFEEITCQCADDGGGNAEWLKLWADYVGPTEAGRIILGS